MHRSKNTAFYEGIFPAQLDATILHNRRTLYRLKTRLIHSVISDHQGKIICECTHGNNNPSGTRGSAGTFAGNGISGVLAEALKSWIC